MEQNAEKNLSSEESAISTVITGCGVLDFGSYELIILYLKSRDFHVKKFSGIKFNRISFDV